MKRLFALLGVLLLCPLTHAQTSRPVPQVDRVLIISIDGLRPDVMLRARTPNLHRLFETGSFSFWAQTVPTANTLPAHTSMLTGMSVEKHGINFNDERATTRPIYPKAATLFELAKRNGYTTAMVAGKAKFAALEKPGTIDWASAPLDPKTTDANVADHAGAVLRLHEPQVMFVHFPGADGSGHAKGWGSPEQMTSIEQIDESVGMLLNALRTSGLDQSTIVIISADHGGSGKSHGANDLRSLHIPWIINGPGVRKNYDLTQVREITVKTTDTFATACYILGIDLPDGIEGKPIVQAFQSAELLTESKPNPPASAPATQMSDADGVNVLYGDGKINSGGAHPFYGVQRDMIYPRRPSAATQPTAAETQPAPP